MISRFDYFIKKSSNARIWRQKFHVNENLSWNLLSCYKRNV